MTNVNTNNTNGEWQDTLDLLRSKGIVPEHTDAFYRLCARAHDILFPRPKHLIKETSRKS